MFAAGGIALELGLLGAGVVVALAAVAIAARSRSGRADPSPRPPEADGSSTRRVAGPERRMVARAPVARPVVVRRRAGEQRTFAVDIGIGGVLLAGPADLAVGELVELMLDLDGPVQAPAEVVRDGPNGMKGVRFAALDGPARGRLERYVRSAPQPA